MIRQGHVNFNLAWHCLGRQAIERGAKPALIVCDGPEAFRSWTYGELDRMARRLAAGLTRSGLKKGDRVMISAANGVEFILAFFATIAIGCVAQPPILMREDRSQSRFHYLFQRLILRASSRRQCASRRCGPTADQSGALSLVHADVSPKR